MGLEQSVNKQNLDQYNEKLDKYIEKCRVTTPGNLASKEDHINNIDECDRALHYHNLIMKITKGEMLKDPKSTPYDKLMLKINEDRLVKNIKNKN